MRNPLPRGPLPPPPVDGRDSGCRPRTRKRRRRFARLGRRLGDEGFVLLETLVAISLISVVMAGFTTFFINSVASTSMQRATQAATEVANSAVERVRGLPASDLTKGRDLVVVQAQFTGARLNSAIGSWLPATAMSEAFDPAAAGTGGGGSAPVPTSPITPVTTINNVTYTVNEYLGTCVIPTTNLTAGCLASYAANIPVNPYLRLVVAVTWTGANCPQTQCSYLTSTLLSAVADPLFNLTTSPPDIPLLTYPGPKIAAVNDVVKLRPSFTAFPRYRFSIAGVLPVGLSLNTSTGLISGTPLVVTPVTTLTVTLTDGFDRTATATVTVTVVPALVGNAPLAQASLVGTAIAALAVSASGGQTPYLWTVPAGTLPPGLSLLTVANQAVISGTPTGGGPLPQTYPVVLTVTDLANRTATVPISWTINYPPFAAAVPGPQKSTVNTALLTPLILTVTGGSGSFTWTGGASLPPGLALTAAGIITGTPTAVGTTSVTLTATDTKSSVSPGVFAFQTFTFAWTVLAKPTVISPGNQNWTIGQLVSTQLTTSCPNAPCSYSWNNGPATFAVNSAGLLTGTITSAAQTFSGVTVTVTDNSGAIVPSATFSVTVNPKPTISNPGTQTTARSTVGSLNVAGLVSGGTAPLTYAAANLPSWLTLNSSTGAVTGTAPGTPGTTTGVILTVTDASGTSASSAAFSWIVSGPPSAPLLVGVVNGDSSTTVSWTAPTSANGAPVTGYTATLNSGASCTTAGALTCVIGGLTNGLPYSLTATATNSVGTGPVSAAVTAIPYPALLATTNTNLTLWLDGADPVVVFGSSTCTGAVATTAIGCWKDKSAQLENFTQGTTANQPGVAKWNGLNAANFVDSTDVLNSVNPTDRYQTVFVAANVTNPAGPNVIIDLFGRATVDNNVRIGTGAGRSAPNGQDWSTGTGSPPLNWTNGSQATNANQPLALITSDQAASVQSWAASVSNTFMSRGVVGQVGDVITFDKALTTAERRTVEEYLAHKWGVPITPQAPTAITAGATGKTTADLSWVAPGFDGGRAVSGYTVTSSAGSQTCTAALSCTITGLSKKTSYTFTVTATNAVGTGPASGPSNPVTTQ